MAVVSSTASSTGGMADGGGGIGAIVGGIRIVCCYCVYVGAQKGVDVLERGHV